MWKCGMALCAALLCAGPVSAQVVKLEIASREPMNAGEPAGAAGPFELIRGRIHGEVDPRDPHNAIIQDLGLAPRNARGKVEYVATFALAKPVDLAKASRVLLYQVVNRGNGQASANAEGDITLVSGWQGDVIPTATNQTIAVPVARKKDGSPVTGRVIARFFDLPDGAHSAPIRLASLGTPQPYRPADLAETSATLTWHTRENYAGQQDAKHTVPRADWAFADCESTPWPGRPDPSRICVKDAFRAGRFYELVYTAKDPLVLGVGLAATRDIVSFFRHGQADASGTPNPVAGVVDHAISLGDSQSGNFIRTFIHLGFNQDTQNRIVWDGAFPRIAARQTPINLRFGLPGGAAGMYEPGSDGVVWWTRYADKARGLKAAGLLDRCAATKTCPKIVEAFGSAEFWGLRMSPDLIGTDATRDLALPSNVRRYYYPSTTHGGGRGGFPVEAIAAANSPCTLPANPNPQAEQTRALTRALVDWVAKGTPPPLSRYPTLANGDLVPATRAALGMPEIPGLPFSDRLLNPVLRYDFGPGFHAADLSGVMTRVPPRVVGVLPTYVPRVNEDGNETSGVLSVQLQAPLGTYLGWNTFRAGVFAGHGCGFQGGWIPFAKTKAERIANRDPRLSLEERYGTHDGYVAVVRKAAEQAVTDRVLLPDDAARILRAAEASKVLESAIAKGYAAVSTDTGHTGDQMDFGIGHPEKIADWAHRAVHEMTVIAKAVVERAGGRAPLRSYFTGCSTGGQQALSEAQRYPADYDGIIAGAPGNHRINLIYGFLWSWLATHDASGNATLPPAKFMYTGLADPVVSPLDTIEVLRARRQRERRPRRDTALLSLLPRSRNGALWRRHRYEHVRRPRRALRHGWSAASRRTASPHRARSTGASIARGRCAPIRPSPATWDPEASMTPRTSPVPRRGRRTGGNTSHRRTVELKGRSRCSMCEYPRHCRSEPLAAWT